MHRVIRELALTFAEFQAFERWLLAFDGGARLDSDIASAAKVELIRTPERDTDNHLRIAYDIRLECA